MISRSFSHRPIFTSVFGVRHRQKEARGRQKQAKTKLLKLEIKSFFGEYTFFQSKKSKTHRQNLMLIGFKDFTEKKPTKLLEEYFETVKNCNLEL